MLSTRNILLKLTKHGTRLASAVNKGKKPLVENAEKSFESMLRERELELGCYGNLRDDSETLIAAQKNGKVSSSLKIATPDMTLEEVMSIISSNDQESLREGAEPMVCGTRDSQPT